MPMKPRKVPMRMCVGCREMKPKAALLRVVKPREGEARIDRTGREPGRGAYICPQPDCLRKARKSKALERDLSTQLGEDVYSQLEAQLIQSAPPEG